MYALLDSQGHLARNRMSEPYFASIMQAITAAKRRSMRGFKIHEAKGPDICDIPAIYVLVGDIFYPGIAKLTYKEYCNLTTGFLAVAFYGSNTELWVLEKREYVDRVISFYERYYDTAPDTITIVPLNNRIYMEP